jgi:MerR family regulatory protein
VVENLAISDVARVFGLQTSAIRYYEQIGILPPAMRKNGQRRYNNSALFASLWCSRPERWGSPWRKYASYFSGSRPGLFHRNAGTNSLNEKSRNSGTG